MPPRCPLDNAAIAELLAVASASAPYPILKKALRRAALEAGVAPDRVLNFMPAAKLLEWVTQVRGRAQ